MKKRFTFLIAAYAALMLIFLPGTVKGQSDYSTDYTGNITPAAGTNAESCTVVISENNYGGIKAGTSKKGGGTINITVPSGTKYLHLHIAAWNGDSSVSPSITPNTYSSTTSISLTSDSGITGSGTTYTLAGTLSNYYKVITFTNALTQDIQFAFATNANKKRFVIWGVTAEEESTTPTCTTSPTSLAFGEIQVGDNDSKTVTVTTANLSSALSLSVGSGYAVSQASIPQNATSTTVTVTCTPTAIGAQNGTLTISGGGLASSVSVNLTATGTCVPDNLTYATPDPLTLSGDYVDYTLTPATGNGGSISYAVTTNPDSGASIVSVNTFRATKTGTYVVTATQAAFGNYCEGSANITIVVNSTAPSCTITPDEYAFGEVLVNSTQSAVFTVNTANLTGNLTVSIDETDNGFSVELSSISQNATSTTVTVTYAPTSVSDEIVAILSISGGGLAAATEISVSGTASAGKTITFNEGSGTCDTPSITGLSGSSITLPSASPSSTCAEMGWTFAGWATAAVSETTTAPDPLYAAGASYEIGNANATLYAVYKEGTGAFDNTTTGSWPIYSTVSNTNYYATGSISSGKFSTTTTEDEAIVFTFEKPDGYGAGEFAIKKGNDYITYSSNTNLGTDNTNPYKWIISNVSASEHGTWRVTASTTTNQSTVRGFIFQDHTVNGQTNTYTRVFGAYSVNNPNGNTYFDVEIGGASTIKYNSNPVCLEKVATPQLSVAAGTYTSVQSVAITCETTGATIKYKTTENGEWQNYSTAISVGENMTIWAKAIKEGMADSDEVSAAYVINLPLTTMDAIFAKATANGSTASNVNVVFNNWVVSGKTSNTAYVTDNEGKGFIIYTNNHGFNVNDKLSGTVEGTPLKLYNGASEFTNLTSNTTGLSVSNNGEITVLTKTIADLSGVNTDAVVTINNLTYNGTVLSDGSNTIKPYNQLYNFGTTFVTDHAYNVTGVYLQYNPKEILPRSAADIVEVEYNITVTQPASGGTISSNKTTAKYGENVILTASAAANYRFSSWTVMNGETPVTVENNQFTMPKGNVTVTATFVPTYAIEFADMSNGSVSATPNPAIAGETVELTISPVSGYALQSIRAYKKGDTETPVTIDANNQFTMPAYAVTVEATFSVEYTVTYHRNYTVSDVTITTVKCGEGANVPVAAANTFDAPTGKLFKIWNTQADGQGDDYDPAEADYIPNIHENTDLYAQWRDIQYHITYNVNGDTSETEEVDYGESTTYQPSLSPLTFLGWSLTSGGSVEGKTYTPTGTTEDITLYAVFGAAGNESLTINEGNSGLPTSGYYDGEKTINSKVYYCNQLGSQNPNQNKVIQFKKDVGYLYNETDFGAITSIVITYYSSDKTLSVKAGASENPTSAEAINPNISENVYTFDIPSNCHYFLLVNGNGTSQVSSIEINYESISSVTITNITTTESLSEIPDNTSILVKNGGILKFTGTNSNPQNLIVEEGGQLILSGESKDGVKATFQREVVGYDSSTDNNDNYILLANPTTDIIDPNVAGMLANNYDLYYFDEASNGAEWRNYKKETFNLVNGTGYLYANSVTKTLNFAGTAPTATSVSGIPLSYTADNNFEGFNLIGNPMAVNITGMKINAKACSYYKLNDDGSFTTVNADNVSSNPVIVGQAFVVEASAKGDKLNLNPASKDANEYNDEVIRLEVSNSKYTDVAYVCFGNSLPLTKINHLNDEAPMLYVHSESADRAVAVMNERSEVKSINVNFEAKTMGTYTISGKIEKGNFSYMHLYDRLTGVDTDLLESDYTFIGSTNDAAGRFILNLESVDDNGSSTGSETFAYQSGDNIIVNGEGELQVFDVTGRMVMSQHINGAQIVNGLNTGVYVFRMEGKVQKVVIR